MSIIGNLPFNLQNGTTADATQVDANFAEIVTDVNNNAAHNGVNTDITALSALTTPITPVQGGSTVYFGQGAGTANAQTVPTPTPSNFTLVQGNTIHWLPSVTNTGALQLNVNGTGLVTVLARGGNQLAACIGGEVLIGDLATAVYDGTEWVLDLDTMYGFGTMTNLASATPDLGTALSHTINITGTTTITSFGSSATATRPLYKLTFSGILILTYNATSMILPGSGNIPTAVGDTADALYLGSGNWQVINYARRNGQPLNFAANFIQNYITGLTLTLLDTNTAIAVAAGEATDSTNADTMLVNSSITKTFASWVVGSGNGGLDTGVIAGTTWYHIYAIKRVDTGVVDVLISLSATAPTMPTNYTLKRRVGSFKTNGSSQVTGCTQTGDQFIWVVRAADATATGMNSDSARTNLTLTVPTGVAVNALFRATIIGVSSNVGLSFQILQETDQSVSTDNAMLDLSCANGGFGSAAFSRTTNTSAQIAWRSRSSGGTFNVGTYGWIDTRGRFG